MRINELVQGRQKLSIQHFVKPSLAPGERTMQKKDQKLLTASVHLPAFKAQTPARDLPLFMEPVFKAKDFDPL